MKPIVSFDLDMTLLNHHDFKIPDSALRALKKLRDHFHIVLATGRDMDSHFSRDFRDLVLPDGIVHLNGTKVTVGDQLIYEHTMDKGLLERLLTFAQHNDYSIGVTIGNEDYYTHPEQVKEHDVMRWGESGRQFLDPWLLMERDVRTLAYIGLPDKLERMKEAFTEMKFLLFAGGTGADVVEKGISKAKGLEILCSHFGTSLEAVYAFGDSMNDYEMIRDAGIGIAMGNAIEPIKEVADYITTAVDCDGIWNACMHFQLFNQEGLDDRLQI